MSYAGGLAASRPRATRRSFSAFRSHFAVSFFIQDGAFFRDVAQEPVAFLDAALQPFWRSYDQVQWKWRFKYRANSDGLTRFIRALHHHQQIHVAVFVWLAIRKRAKQDDLVGLESLRNLARVTTDRRHRNVGQTVARERNVASLLRHCGIVTACYAASGEIISFELPDTPPRAPRRAGCRRR